ncbi:hypothetical protein SAMN02927921_01996 [Sinomicrobium oceani]|uniref:Uncharacterized protein n=1 Tax=Sinomicrobium oceani TaxID=1150368 RepID=A0A1K1PS83_9FLAO|nr:hypothetical protein SAMN02927921_01996 [Sinomicrobium oceani]
MHNILYTQEFIKNNLIKLIFSILPKPSVSSGSLKYRADIAYTYHIQPFQKQT